MFLFLPVVMQLFRPLLYLATPSIGPCPHIRWLHVPRFFSLNFPLFISLHTLLLLQAVHLLIVKDGPLTVLCPTGYFPKPLIPGSGSSRTIFIEIVPLDYANSERDQEMNYARDEEDAVK
jgi:hypothetical protein